MILVGIDSGSTVTKIAAIDGGAVVEAVSVPTGTDPIASGSGLLDGVRRALPGEMSVCVTGYGRKLLADLGPQKTEISCHARGAHAVVTGAVSLPEVSSLQSPVSGLAGFTLLDIGGQDSKAIRVDAAGRATDFAMNDKCAAGTGRFLEVIGRTLGFGVEGISAAALASGRKARLSSMCTVFADSEVVSHIARGERPDEIAWAACYAVAERCAGLVKRIGFEQTPFVSRDERPAPTLIFTGGVSDIGAVGDALREILKVEVISPPMARFSGAIGAALFAGRG